MYDKSSSRTDRQRIRLEWTRCESRWIFSRRQRGLAEVACGVRACQIEHALFHIQARYHGARIILGGSPIADNFPTWHFVARELLTSTKPPGEPALSTAVRYLCRRGGRNSRQVRQTPACDHSFSRARKCPLACFPCASPDETAIGALLAPCRNRLISLKDLERARRIERPTLTLARLCSTPELRPHSKWEAGYRLARTSIQAGCASSAR